MLSVMFDMGLESRSTTTEVAPVAGRARLCLLDPGEDRRQHADLQIRGAQRRAPVRQDGDLHAEADQGRQRLGHAHPPVDLEGERPLFAGNHYADLSETALYYIGGIISTPRRSTPSPTRRPTATSG
jgi:hypothetical protein